MIGSVCPGGDLVILQGRVNVELLYLDRGCQSRERSRKRRREKRGRERATGSGEMKEGEVSISLYLPGKHVKRTKQMNRREEGMITTKMIIFNQ